MTRDEILQLSGRELDAAVARAKGQRILTYEEMRDEALAVWQEQPTVQYFSKGFYAEREANGAVGCWQPFEPYHSSWQYAGPLLEEALAGGVSVGLGKGALGHILDAYRADGEQFASLVGDMPALIARAYVLWRQERAEVAG